MIPTTWSGITGSARVSPAPTSGFSVFRAIAVWVVLAMLVANPLAAAARQSPASAFDLPAIERATAAILAQQDASGAFPGFSGEPDMVSTLDALTALAAARAAGAEVDLAPTLAYLAGEALVFAQTNPASAARLAIALAAAGGDTSAFASVDPLALVIHGFDEATGFCGTQVFEHSLCMLALAAGRSTVPDAWVAVLRANQNDDGGWVYDGTAESRTSDTNTTAVALQALIAAGVAVDDPAVVAGREFLRGMRADGGGFAYLAGGPLVSDANSTALCIQALIALGEDPRSADWGDPVAALLAFQNESGFFGYSAEYPDDNLLATLQALPALAGLAMPVVAPQ